MISVFQKKSDLDTNNVLFFLISHKNSALGILFLAVALVFLVFFIQTTWLQKSNYKQPERTCCCRELNDEDENVNVEMMCSANQE